MRNRKKTAIFTSVVLALALSLSACASDDPDNGGTSDPGDGGVTTQPLDQMTTTTLP